MSPLPHRYWQEMTSKEFAALEEPEAVIALLPVGAIEQHGPHLPLSVDGAINRGIVDLAVSRMEPSLPVLVLPPLPVGYSDEHRDFPGTLSLSASTLIALWTEMGECVHRAGMRKLVIFNSHGGNPPVMDIVARDLRARLGMLVVASSWYEFGLPEGLFGPMESVHGIHGGGIETSLMLHLRPDLVHDRERRNFESLGIELAGEFRHLSPTRRPVFAWQAQDLNLFGACGDALDADERRGRLLLEHATGSLLDLLSEVDRFPLDLLRGRV